jgi:hypothetical protein
VNSQERFEYEMLIDRLNAVSDEYSRTVMEISMAKTRVENDYDRFMRDVYQVFGDHPDFDQLTAYGYYDGWTGAANVRN